MEFAPNSDRWLFDGDREMAGFFPEMTDWLKLFPSKKDESTLGQKFKLLKLLGVVLFSFTVELGEGFSELPFVYLLLSAGTAREMTL